MAHDDTPVGIPDTLRAGDTWEWTYSFPGHSHADGWTVKVIFAGASGPITVTGQAGASDSEFTFSRAAEDTAEVEAGTYRWIARATKDAESFTLDRGVVTVLANVEAAPVGAAQTHAEKVLQALRAAIEGRIEKDQEEIEIGGRKIVNIEIRELIRLEAAYSYRVWQERNPGAPNPTRKVRFTS